MSHITGDLLLALSKSLPRAFSEIQGELNWAVSEIEQEPTIDGEIFNVKVNLIRVNDEKVTFPFTKETAALFENDLISRHQADSSKKGQATMQCHIDLYETLTLRVERMKSTDPFGVTRVDSSIDKHDGSKYRVHYISAGLGESATGYPQFDASYHLVTDLVAKSYNAQLRDKLKPTALRNLTIEVNNNWLDESTFEPLQKGIDWITLAISELAEDADTLKYIARHQFITEAELDKATRQGQVVEAPITEAKINHYLYHNSYSRVSGYCDKIADAAMRVQHNEAIQSIRSMSHSLISTIKSHLAELDATCSEMGSAILAMRRENRQEYMEDRMDAFGQKLRSVYHMLLEIQKSYQMFINSTKG